MLSIIETSEKFPVVVQKNTYKGTERIDLRHNFYVDGKLQPTQKGIVLPADNPKIIIQLIKAVMKESGIIVKDLK